GLTARAASCSPPGVWVSSGFMSDVTRILSAIERGEPHAADQLLPLVYDELRKLAAQKLAQEKPGHNLQATALVHEAYLRLVDVERAQHWHSRGHFFAACAEALRRILVNRAQGKRSNGSKSVNQQHLRVLLMLTARGRLRLGEPSGFRGAVAASGPFAGT